MTEVNAIAVAQAQLAADFELVERYGHDEAADHFGGCYWNNEPPVAIVALFTTAVDQHRAVLHSRVTRPAQLVVRATQRTWRQVRAANHEVAAMLMNARAEPGVHEVGIGLREGHFVVHVHIEPYTAERAAQLAALVHPHAIVVQQGGPYQIR
jgi:hypothetical protein